LRFRRWGDRPPKASPENPASDEDLIAKYRSCAEWSGVPREQAERSIELIMGIEKLKDVHGLMKLMCIKPGKK